MQLNFPFSTIAFACEGPFYMTDGAVTDEGYAGQLRESLDRVLAKAFDMGGREDHARYLPHPLSVIPANAGTHVALGASGQMGPGSSPG